MVSRTGVGNFSPSSLSCFSAWYTAESAWFFVSMATLFSLSSFANFSASLIIYLWITTLHPLEPFQPVFATLKDGFKMGKWIQIHACRRKRNSLLANVNQTYPSSKSEHNSSNLTLVSVVSICFGPSVVAVINDKQKHIDESKDIW